VLHPYSRKREYNLDLYLGHLPDRKEKKKNPEGVDNQLFIG
jgi:hypothetical protein